MPNDRMKIDVSTSTILRVVGVLLGLYTLFLVRDIIVLFFLVLVLVSALSPVIEQWSKKMLRSMAVALMFLLILSALSLIGLLIVPPAVVETRELINRFPDIVSNFVPIFSQFWATQPSADAINTLRDLGDSLTRVSGTIFQTTLGVFGGLATFVTALILAFYLLLEERELRTFFLSLVPPDNRRPVQDISDRIGKKMGDWLRGQLFLMLTIFFLTFIALSVLQVKFALTLAVLAGLLEIVPYLGPVLSAIPAILVAYTDSPVKALLVLVLFVVIQQLESSVIAPKILQRAVGLSPVIIIIALLIGGKLLGVLGAILAVPLTMAATILIEELPRFKNNRAARA